jgi:serine/threonine protein kinase
MEPVADFDLRRYLAKEAWTTEELATLRTFVGCLCSALAYLHENKCRHKDLKPHNILIKDSTVYIADFGIAFDWTESQRETTVGRPEAYTEAYVAPEVR